MTATAKSTIRCATKRCQDAIAQYGEAYHGVYPFYAESPPSSMPDAIAKCSRCGGVTNGTDWKHSCHRCGVEVEAGALVGFFVPHRCQSCDKELVAEQRAKGQVCGNCGQVLAYCCC